MNQDWHHYCIYANPKDYPGAFVVRRWAIRPMISHPVPDKEPIAVVGTIEEARKHVPPGLVRITRDAHDTMASYTPIRWEVPLPEIPAPLG